MTNRPLLWMRDNAMNTCKYIGVFSVCLLTACAPHKSTTEQAPNGAIQPQLNEPNKPVTEVEGKPNTSAAKLSSWEISGAMAARNNKKGWSASLNWAQQGINHYKIRLFGPLGGGSIIIEKSGGVITYADGPKKISSRNADELLVQQTGIRLPVNNLYYWVRGLPAPGAVQSSHVDQHHNLSTLNQAGYTIHYSNYTTINNVSLPGKIQLQGRDATIKLVIKQWKI